MIALTILYQVNLKNKKSSESQMSVILFKIIFHLQIILNLNGNTTLISLTSFEIGLNDLLKCSIKF